MALDPTTLLSSMVSAGQNLGGTLWTDMQHYAVPELQKIAIQIVAIEASMLQPSPPYTPAGAQALLTMQLTASVGVIVAMTTLTLLVVQAAINSILSSIKTMVNNALSFPLI